MNFQARRSVLNHLVVITGLAAVAFAPLAIAQAKKPKYTTKEVMEAIHKGQDNIGKRVGQGTASKEEIAKMVEYYESLPLNEPPRGSMASWKEKTSKLVSSARAFKDGKPTAAAMYKGAANCKACHIEHKPEEKK